MIDYQDIMISGRWEKENSQFVLKDFDNADIFIPHFEEPEWANSGVQCIRAEGVFVPKEQNWHCRVQGRYFIVKPNRVMLREQFLKEMKMSDRVNYPSGAQRSADVEAYRYDLFHPIFMKRVAQVWAEGATKYGEHNWEQGFPMHSLFNHLLAHIFEYLSGDRTEDHLGHAACNIIMLIVESEMRYDENRSHLRLPGNVLSPEMLEEIKAHRLMKQDLKGSKERISERLMDLSISNKIRRKPGNSFDFKLFANARFSDMSFVTLREVMKGFGYDITEDDMILNFDAD